jgi:hypothetical protein
MKTLLPVATALALVGAANPSSAIAQGAKPSGFASGTQNTQKVADQSGFRPQRVSARQLAVADRVL